jgi:hypothetical protein
MEGDIRAASTTCGAGSTKRTASVRRTGDKKDQALDARGGSPA